MPSHISVSVNVQQIESGSAPLVLNVDSRRQVLIQVSFAGYMDCP